MVGWLSLAIGASIFLAGLGLLHGYRLWCLLRHPCMDRVEIVEAEALVEEAKSILAAARDILDRAWKVGNI